MGVNVVVPLVVAVFEPKPNCGVEADDVTVKSKN